MPEYKIHIAQHQHYSCLLCGRCCRRFHVRLEKAECIRLANLDWQGEPNPHDFTVTINGHEYFKRNPDGGCVFLDEKGACRMHAKFGFDVKALTCRGYPMNIVSTFPGELSVLARMDCPAVLKDHGTPLPEQRKDIEKLVSEMKFGKPFTESQLCGLERETIETIRDAVTSILEDHTAPLPNRIRAALALLDACQKLSATFLNDHETMQEVWKNFKTKYKPSDTIPQTPGLSAYSRIVYRTWLAAYCRRDEEILDRSFFSRLKLFKRNLMFILGHGNWHELGWEHPDYSFAKAAVFKRETQKTEYHDEAWAPFMRFLQTRLECFQFFGVSYYGTDFFSGLRALLKTYAHTLATARYHAAANGRNAITEDDVFQAVLSIDHCHGRSPSLNFRSSRSNENYFSGKRFDSLLADLGWA